MIAHVAKKQTALTVPEESGSESENIPLAVTSTPVKTKTIATTLNNSPVNSRNMVTGVLNDSTNIRKKKTRPHRPQILPPNKRHSTTRLLFAPQTDVYQPFALYAKITHSIYQCLMVSLKNSNFSNTYLGTIKKCIRT